MADSTLTAIRKKVRRLTRSPETTQLSTADIDEYVNTFIQYDMPEHLKLHTLRDNFIFYTEPDVDVYGTNVINPNYYINTDKPVYIAGRLATFSQSQEEFYNFYPKINNIAKTSNTGDGVTTAFVGTIVNIPIIKKQALFTSIGAANNGLELHDDGAGLLTGDGVGTINYLTGAYTLAFTVAPALAQPIYSQTVAYKPSIPTMILYFKNEIIVRPIPDKVYKIELQVYIRPTELLAAGSKPELEQWWQYIAYGASKKIFEDRTDLESVALLMPEFKQQENLVLNRTVEQQTKERTATIYTNSGKYGFGLNWKDI